MKNMKLANWIAGLMLSLFSSSLIAADAVDITYGYHPYWTGGWNGVIIKHKKLHEKYLPKGSTVKFEAHLTGPPMVNALLADKMQIGTMGDMPSLVATTKRKIADIRLVSTPMFSNGQNCNKIVVPADAPDFGSVEEAGKWLSGKPFAVHRGTCANRFVDSIIAKPTNSVRVIVFDSSGCCAIDISAWTTARPSAWPPSLKNRTGIRGSSHRSPYLSCRHPLVRGQGAKSPRRSQ